jgi:DNA-binding protein HU-beta
MNKTQLIDALAARLGDRHTAASAVDGLLETIVDTVRAGGSVSLTGFGVFESRARAARMARNPRTGESVAVAATTVPAFRPGVGFRAAVGGSEEPATGTAGRRAAAAPATSAEAVADAPARIAQGSANGSAASTPKAAKKAATPAAKKAAKKAATPAAPKATKKAAPPAATKAAKKAVTSAAPKAVTKAEKPAKDKPAKGKSGKAKSGKAKAKAGSKK